MSDEKSEMDVEKSDGAETETKLERSIYDYFQWKVNKLSKHHQEEAISKDNNVSPSDESPPDSNNNVIESQDSIIQKYTKVIDALKELEVANGNEGNSSFPLDQVPGLLTAFQKFLTTQENDVDLVDEVNIDGDDKQISIFVKGDNVKDDNVKDDNVKEDNIKEENMKDEDGDDDQPIGNHEDETKKRKLLEDIKGSDLPNWQPAKKRKGTKLEQLRAQLDYQKNALEHEKKKHDAVSVKIVKVMSKSAKKDEVIADLKQKLQKLREKVKEEKTKTTEPVMSKRDAQWERRFQKLSEFLSKHSADELKLLNTQDPGLSDWITTQRQAYHNKLPILTQQRINRLNAIGFTWKSPMKSTVPFETRIKQCLEFKERYGHLTIPFLTEELNADGTEPTEEEKKFRLWAHNIRVKYKRRMVDGVKCALNPLMLRALDDIGFDWRLDDITQDNRSAIQDRFCDRVEQLRKVAETYGSCNDKKNIVAMYPDNRPLLQWIKFYRRQYHRWTRGESSTLTEERRKMLEDIGFDFNPRRHYAPPKTGRYKHFKTMKLQEEGVYVDITDLQNNMGNGSDPATIEYPAGSGDPTTNEYGVGNGDPSMNEYNVGNVGPSTNDYTVDNVDPLTNQYNVVNGDPSTNDYLAA